jgi:hypothetical protein
MNNCITLGGAAFYTFQVIEVTQMRFGACFDQLFGGSVGAHQSEHLVTGL